MIRKRMTYVFFIVAGSFPFAILRNILLARGLSKADMGLMSVLITLVSFLVPVALLGYHNAIIRFLSVEGHCRKYDWKKFIRRIHWITAGVAMVGIAAAARIYHFSWIPIGFLVASVLSMIGAELYKEVIRAQGRYELSLILHKSERYALPLFLVVLFAFGAFHLRSILVGFSLLTIAYGFTLYLFTRRSAPCGDEPVPIRVHKDAFFFWGMDVSLIVLVTLDKLMVAKWTSYETMAVYYTTFTIMRLYDLAAESLEYVLLPHSNKVQRIRLKAWIVPILSVCAVITLFYLSLGGAVMELLFQGKYSQGVLFIPWFCGVGVMRVLYIVPSSIIGGRLGSAALKQWYQSNLLLVILNVLVAVAMTSRFGAVGAVVSSLIVWSVRLAVGYGILFRYRRTAELSFTLN